MDGSKWKSHAKEVMEDSTKALASSAETRVAGNPSFPESSIVPPPSNFVWPGREGMEQELLCNIVNFNYMLKHVS